LAAKTQVIGPDTDDFVRNRLTHTLEVAQIGRELGQALGCDPDVVDTACLAHDLGHPPFGHNGEAALDEVARDIGGFEGNAQTLRLLTRLEAKVEGAGLNLTRASLDAATKYPWRRGEGPVPRKYGVYADDLEVFTWMRAPAPTSEIEDAGRGTSAAEACGVEGAGDAGRGHEVSGGEAASAVPRRCVEAQVMDFADDVAYSVHDVEDGVVRGVIDLAALEDPGVRKEIWKVVQDWYDPQAEETALEEAYSRLRGLRHWPSGRYDGSRSAQAALKDLTSRLIGRFSTAAERATRTAYGDRSLTRYRADLVVPDDLATEIACLKGIAARYLMRTRERESVRARQAEMVHELAEALLARAPDALEPAFAADFRAAPDDAGRLRVVVDQIASLTDASASAWHTVLCGSGKN